MLKRLSSNLVAGLLLIGLVGCAAKVPQATQTYTVLLGNQIAEGKLNHLSLIDEWEKVHIKKAEQYLEYVFEPDFVRDFMKVDGRPYKMLKESLKTNCEGEKADIVLAIVKAVSEKIQKKRRELLMSIQGSAQGLKSTVQQNYADIERMHRMILSNIQSAVKGGDLDKTIRDAMLKPLKEAVPFDEAGQKLEKLMKKGEKLK